MLRFSRASRLFLMASVSLVIVFMYAPLFVLVLNAFNERQISGWPISDFSFKWWAIAYESESIRAALLNSTVVALSAMSIAMVLGSLVAFALSRYDFFGKGVVNLLVVLPIALPGVVTGVAFSNTYSNFLSPAGFQIGYFGMIVAHATFCIVMVFKMYLRDSNG